MAVQPSSSSDIAQAVRGRLAATRKAARRVGDAVIDVSGGAIS